MLVPDSLLDVITTSKLKDLFDVHVFLTLIKYGINTYPPTAACVKKLQHECIGHSCAGAAEFVRGQVRWKFLIPQEVHDICVALPALLLFVRAAPGSRLAP